MNAALRTLHSLNICWKSIGNYNMKCRWLPNFPAYLKNPVNDPSPTNQFLPRDPVSSTVGGADDIPSNKNTVKFEIQVAFPLSSVLFLYSSLANKFGRKKLATTYYSFVTCVYKLLLGNFSLLSTLKIFISNKHPLHYSCTRQETIHISLIFKDFMARPSSS